MVLSQSTPAAQWEKARHCQLAAAKEHPQDILLPKSPPSFVSLGQPQDVGGSKVLRTHLTLLDKDTWQPLFQQISPTSPDMLSQTITSAKKGS